MSSLELPPAVVTSISTALVKSSDARRPAARVPIPVAPGVTRAGFYRVDVLTPYLGRFVDIRV